MGNELQTISTTDVLAEFETMDIGTYNEADRKHWVSWLRETNYGWCELKEYLSHLQSSKWYHWRDKEKKNGFDYSPATIAIKLATAKHMGDDWIEKHPGALTTEMELAWLKAKKTSAPDVDPAIDEDKFLDWPDVQKLIEGSKNRKIKLIISFLAETGCRIDEALGLKLVNIRRNGACWRCTVHGKGNKNRVVAMSFGLQDEIAEVFGGDEFLFEHSGRPFCNDSVSARIGKESMRILGRKISAHSLRHSWACEQDRLGRSLSEISKYMGHASTSTTSDIYMHRPLSSEKAMLSTKAEPVEKPVKMGGPTEAEIDAQDAKLQNELEDL